MNDFCNVKKVQENINHRINECEKSASSKPYFLIIPFTMSGSRNKKKKVNEDCILKPIKELEKTFRVFVIYLRKINTHHLKEKDALMKDVAIATISTKPDRYEDYEKSKDLEKVLREKS